MSTGKGYKYCVNCNFVHIGIHSTNKLFPDEKKRLEEIIVQFNTCQISDESEPSLTLKIIKGKPLPNVSLAPCNDNNPLLL